MQETYRGPFKGICTGCEYKCALGNSKCQTFYCNSSGLSRHLSLGYLCIVWGREDANCKTGLLLSKKQTRNES